VEQSLGDSGKLVAYNAIITELKDVRKHPNADRLQLASCWGDQVVVGLGQKEGDIGIYFPTDGQLSDEFVTANNLYNKSTVQQLGRPDPGSYGFFDKNRRVRAQTFRGEKSEGFWIPLDALKFAVDIQPWTPAWGWPEVGWQFTEYCKVPICNRYETPATRNKGGTPSQRSTKRGELVGFPKHYDTKQFRYEVEHIPVGSVVYITEKLHGTSHRVGRVCEKPATRWYHRLLGQTPANQYGIVHGTRNVVLGSTSGQGFYGSDDFRERATAGLEDKLHKGEVLYGEIVGYHAPDSPIMPRVNVPKELDKTLSTYGSQITYNYGCGNGDCTFYLYRIVRYNEDGVGTELSWAQVKARAAELGIAVVPEIYLVPLLMNNASNLNLDHEWLTDSVNVWAEGPSLLDPTHLREGVAVRVEAPDGRIYTLKHKSFAFKVLEGIVKLDDNSEDMEEAA
jgi:hypothetical protein